MERSLPLAPGAVHQGNPNFERYDDRRTLIRDFLRLDGRLITQAELSRLARVDRMTLWRFLYGLVQPSLRVGLRIADALKVHPRAIHKFSELTRTFPRVAPTLKNPEAPWRHKRRHAREALRGLMSIQGEEDDQRQDPDEDNEDPQAG